MSYSCSDFTDAVLKKMADRGFIDGERIPDADPEAQARIVCEAIDHWADERMALRWFMNPPEKPQAPSG